MIMFIFRNFPNIFLLEAEGKILPFQRQFSSQVNFERRNSIKNVGHVLESDLLKK